MTIWLVILALALVGALLTWALLPSVVGRSLGPIDPERLGFRARGADADLAREVGGAFRHGVRAKMLRPRDRWIERCESLPPQWQAFAFEGAAFGHAALASVGHGRWDRLDQEIIGPRPQFVYLAHVGVGFWSAFRHGRRWQPLLRHVQSYDPLFKHLCFDGYGFKYGFFNFMRNPRAIEHLSGIPGYYRHAAYQGVGRALFFAYLGDRPGLFETVSRFAPHHDADVISGVGLAAAFAGIADPSRAVKLARAVPYEWRPHLHLGLTFGFKARRLTHGAHFDECMKKLPAESAAAIGRAIELCDRIERDVRAESPEDGYRLWRERLTHRMEELNTWEPVYKASLEDDSSKRGGAVRQGRGEES